MLNQILGSKYFTVEIRDAEAEMETCKKLGIKTVPALVIDEDNFTTELDEIVSRIDEFLGVTE
jgi:predicted DsbA family dithiol-disulfide isomerase